MFKRQMATRKVKVKRYRYFGCTMSTELLEALRIASVRMVAEDTLSKLNKKHVAALTDFVDYVENLRENNALHLVQLDMFDGLSNKHFIAYPTNLLDTSERKEKKENGKQRK